MKKAVILSSGVIGLGVIRALGTMGVPIVVIYHDKKDMGYVSKYVTEKIYAPHPEKDEGRYVELLIKQADRLGGNILIPASDATLTTASKYKGELERHYTVACTEWSITEKFIDKKYTYALAEEIGIPAPKTTVPHSVEDLEKYSRSTQYPFLVKPCQSHRYYELFTEKAVRAHNFDQALAAYNKATDAGLEVMLQEIIPGDDTHGVSYNSYHWNGQPLAEFTTEKVRNAPPEFGLPRVMMSKQIPEVIEPGRKILQALGFYGFACTEFKKDARDGIYKFMEVNGRHNMSCLLSVRCGINFPWIQYKHLADGETLSFGDSQTGVYWIDLNRDISFSLKYRNKERYSLAQYLRPYFKPHVFSTLDWGDPRPFVRQCTNFADKAIRAVIAPGKGSGTGAQSGPDEKEQ